MLEAGDLDPRSTNRPLKCRIELLRLCRKCHALDANAGRTVATCKNTPPSGALAALRITFAVEVTNLAQSTESLMDLNLVKTRSVESSVSDSVDTLPLRSRGRVFYDLVITRKWTGTCNAW
jgi:hypothetical protein